MYRYFCSMTHNEFRKNRIEALVAFGYEEGEARAIWNLWCAEVLRVDRVTWELRSTRNIDHDVERTTAEAWKRLAQGEPIQHVIGHTWFRGLKLAVSSAVLIPRPETEELVDIVLERVDEPASILDVGTGSGCIALSLQKEWPQSQVTGLDVSHDALEVAKSNSMAHALDVEWTLGDLMHDPPDRKFDIIVSNPPYIPVEEAKELEQRVSKFEPIVALYSPDGQPIGFYERLAIWGESMLSPLGSMMLETHHILGHEVAQHLKSRGWKHVEIREDDCGKPRFIIAQRP